jgi:hypothetical protein
MSFISLSAVAQLARPGRTAASARYIQNAPLSFSIYGIPCVSFSKLPLSFFLSNSLNNTSSKIVHIYIPTSKVISPAQTVKQRADRPYASGRVAIGFGPKLILKS